MDARNAVKKIVDRVPEIALGPYLSRMNCLLIRLSGAASNLGKGEWMLLFPTSQVSVRSERLDGGEGGEGGR